MEPRPVKKIEITFEDGVTQTVELEGIFYKEYTNYPGGAFPDKNARHTSHEVRWTERP